MTPPRCPHCGAVATADPVGEMIAAMKAGKVATLATPIYTSPTWRPGDTTRCVCPACEPDDEPGGENVHPAPIATKRRRLAWAQYDALNQAKQRREAPSRAEFAAWMRGVAGERGKS